VSKLNKKDRILILGNKGMVGSAIERKLKSKNYQNVIGLNRRQLDLSIQNNLKKYLKKNKIDCIFLCAAKVGGIFSNNKFPANYIFENINIQNNAINESYLSGVKKFLFLGSSCIYPKFSNQPIKESELFCGKLEPTNEAYAMAKIAGIKMCESYNRQYKLDYRSVMPTNLYGQNDNFDPFHSHVIPALISKFHKAKSDNKKTILISGNGKAKRDFLHVDDMAEACIKIMEFNKQKYNKIIDIRCSHINIGSGEEISIKELVIKIAKIVGFNGKIKFDIKKTNGMDRKILNINKIKKIGWNKKISLDKGLMNTYNWFLKNC
tara:strand:- start:61 stop:1023 length:963 start_codon:yes stop_codon:yes gene_type:complete